MLQDDVIKAKDYTLPRQLKGVYDFDKIKGREKPIQWYPIYWLN